MKLQTSCEGCGLATSGAFTRLTKVNGKYLCPDCKANPAGVSRYYCLACSTYSPVARTKGSGAAEFVLYLFMIVPGILYSIWRRSGDSKVCPNCKSTKLTSPNAGTHVKCPDCRELVLADARKCKHCGCGLVPQ